jgi:hypothetical protein
MDVCMDSKAGLESMGSSTGYGVQVIRQTDRLTDWTGMSRRRPGRVIMHRLTDGVDE